MENRKCESCYRSQDFHFILSLSVQFIGLYCRIVGSVYMVLAVAEGSAKSANETNSSIA